jgi:hypothetical protein
VKAVRWIATAVAVALLCWSEVLRFKDPYGLITDQYALLERGIPGILGIVILYVAWVWRRVPL